MAGFFHKIQERMLSPMLFDQLGEGVRVAAPGESGPVGKYLKTLGIIRVTQSENGDGGQAVILRAEVVLMASVDKADVIGGSFVGDSVATLTTTQIVEFRGQLFTIESMAPVEAGTRKLICVARRGEVTSRSSLNGRL